MAATDVFSETAPRACHCVFRRDPATLPTAQQKSGFASKASAYPPVSMTARNVQTTAQTSAKKNEPTIRTMGVRLANQRLDSLPNKRTKKLNGTVQTRIAGYSCDSHPGRVRCTTIQNVMNVLIKVVAMTTRRLAQRSFFMRDSLCAAI